MPSFLDIWLRRDPTIQSSKHLVSSLHFSASTTSSSMTLLETSLNREKSIFKLCDSMCITLVPTTSFYSSSVGACPSKESIGSSHNTRRDLRGLLTHSTSGKNVLSSIMSSSKSLSHCFCSMDPLVPLSVLPPLLYNLGYSTKLKSPDIVVHPSSFPIYSPRSSSHLVLSFNFTSAWIPQIRNGLSSDFISSDLKQLPSFSSPLSVIIFMSSALISFFLVLTATPFLSLVFVLSWAHCSLHSCRCFSIFFISVFSLLRCVYVSIITSNPSISLFILLIFLEILSFFPLHPLTFHHMHLRVTLSSLWLTLVGGYSLFIVLHLFHCFGHKFAYAFVKLFCFILFCLLFPPLFQGTLPVLHFLVFLLHVFDLLLFSFVCVVWV